MRTYNTFNKYPKHTRQEYSTNHKVGFYNNNLQCRCIRGNCSVEHNCIHDPSIVFDLLKPHSKDLVPTQLITAMFEQLDYKHSNSMSGNL